MNVRVLSVVLAVGAAAATSGCASDSCLDGRDGCRVTPPCQKVQFTCQSPGTLSVKTIENVSERPGGWDGLGTVGDVKLSNGVVDVVIAGLGRQNYLDPNGGSILDLAPAGQAKDSVNDIFQVLGIMPGDAAHYTSLTIIDESPTLVAVQVQGTLDGPKATPIATRYELRPCDPGVRVRTEIVNGTEDVQMWSLVDGYYWSGREAVPFAPGEGSGFKHPSFGLLEIDTVFRLFPYMAAAGHTSDAAASSIATASCTDAQLEGFHSDQISAAGIPKRIVPPRGYLVFERFIAASTSTGVSGAIDLALEVRKQVLGEKTVVVTGKVERPAALRLDSERETSVLVSEGQASTPEAERVPWTQIVPAADGTFSARLPAGKPFLVQVSSFGTMVVEKDFGAADADVDLGTLTLPTTGAVTLQVTEAGTARPLDAEVFLVPADEATKTATAGTLHGRFGTCAPWLGPPPGASPACNRVLVPNGATTVEVPQGRYHFYAYKSPFWSLARDTQTVTPGTLTVTLQLAKLPLQPNGTLSADMHVHGAASFDSSIPDEDRVLSFSAAELDVVIATDHDVVYDYARVAQQLGYSSRISTVIGLETTGHIPWLRVPGYGFPLVIGHYNMWPLAYDPSKPRNGGPFDELVEPGALFEKTKPLFTSTVPLIELNHPWSAAEFGRDLGFPRAIFLDLTKDLPNGDDGTGQGIYGRTPEGSSYANNGHHAQEVMNGSDNGTHLQHRAFWFYVLNQGQLRTGTANSDSHSLTDNTVGLPRNVVWAATAPGPTFDINVYNTAVREGRLLGTNGPVIEATIEDEQLNDVPYSLTPFKPKADGKLKIKVTSAPWIPVEEIRIVVNGEVVKHVTALQQPADAFATSGDMTRFDGELPVAELLSGVTGDAWIVVEAGRALPLTGDLGGGLNDDLVKGRVKDGVPDTTDNNGDGVVDMADVKEGSKTGPLNPPPEPKENEAGWHFHNISLGDPCAFTNPFVLDRDGDGRFTAPGVKGGRP